MTSTAAILGGGKIARGFLGHLLFLSGYRTTFIDVNSELVEEITRAGQYNVHVLGAPSKDCVVDNVNALVLSDPNAPAVIAAADMVFVSVGGQNLAGLGPLLASVVELRDSPHPRILNIVVCENWRGAADVVRTAIETALGEDVAKSTSEWLGVAESTVLRSCIDPTDEQRRRDPLAVQVQDHWTLEIDGDAYIGSLPAVQGLLLVNGFSNALERKIYTYNMCNASISYLGSLLGHETLAQAANDPRVVQTVSQACDEIGPALCQAHGYDSADQADYAMRALKKFQDPAITDPISRQVRDPLRKLSRHDRLVGPAMLCLDYGIQPNAISVSIAAALRHTDSADPSAVELHRRIGAQNEIAVLAEIAELPAGSPLLSLVSRQRAELDAFLSS